MKKIITLLVAVGAVLSFQAQAVLVNFDSHASTTSLSGSPGAAATVTNDYAAQGVIFGRAGVSAGVAVVNNANTFSNPNGACGLDAAGNIPFACSGSIYFEFVSGASSAVTDSVSFVVGDSGGDLDSWDIRVFDINNNLLESRAVASNANISVAFAHAGMNRFEVINTTGTTAGYLLDNMNFNAPTTVAVPVPASIALLGLGLLGLWGANRKQ